jgi:N-acetylglucosamine kinase-like BadF-type ATPase
VAEALGLGTRAALIRHVYRDDAPLQQVAPLVLDAAADGDAIARQIVDTQTGRLADQAAWLAARCPDLLRRIAALGGLTGADTYADALRTALEQRLPGWTVRIASERPADGALRRACRARPSS